MMSQETREANSRVFVIKMLLNYCRARGVNGTACSVCTRILPAPIVQDAYVLKDAQVEAIRNFAGVKSRDANCEWRRLRKNTVRSSFESDRSRQATGRYLRCGVGVWMRRVCEVKKIAIWRNEMQSGVGRWPFHVPGGPLKSPGCWRFLVQAFGTSEGELPGRRSAADPCLDLYEALAVSWVSGSHLFLLDFPWPSPFFPKDVEMFPDERQAMCITQAKRSLHRLDL